MRTGMSSENTEMGSIAIYNTGNIHTRMQFPFNHLRNRPLALW